MNDYLLSIVVPTYNEGENLPEFFNRLLNSLDKNFNYEILVIDDCSTDNTIEVVKSFSKYLSIRIIRKPKRTGKPESIIIGIKEAQGKYIAFIDADLEYPPEIINKMIEIAVKNDLDIVLAKRIQKERNFLRKIISIGAKFLAKLLLPSIKKLKDPTTECLIIRKDLINGIEIKPFIKPFLAILNNVLLKYGNGIKVQEIPCELSIRKSGRSSFSIKWIFSYVKELLTLSKFFTFKYIGVAILAALIAKFVNPFIGILSLILSILIRYLVLRKEISLHGLLIAELSSTGIKQLFSITGIWQILGSLTFIGWGIAALIELLLIHLLR